MSQDLTSPLPSFDEINAMDDHEFLFNLQFEERQQTERESFLKPESFKNNTDPNRKGLTMNSASLSIRSCGDYGERSQLLKQKKQKLELLVCEVAEKQHVIWTTLRGEILSGKKEWIGAVLEELLFGNDSCDIDVTKNFVRIARCQDLPLYEKGNDDGMGIFNFIATICKFFPRPKQELRYAGGTPLIYSVISRVPILPRWTHEFIKKAMELGNSGSYSKDMQLSSEFLEEYGIFPYWTFSVPTTEEEISALEEYIVPKFHLYNSHSMRLVEYWYYTVVKESFYGANISLARKLILCGEEKEHITNEIKKRFPYVPKENIDRELEPFSESNIYLIWDAEKRKSDIWCLMIYARFNDSKCGFHCDILAPELFEMIVSCSGYSRKEKKSNKFLIK